MHLSSAHVRLVAFVAIYAVVQPSPEAQTPPTVVALRGATVIDGTGRAPVADATILIDGEHIRAVGPSPAVPVPSEARVIDVRGRTILPGLADLHTHLQGGWDGDHADYLNFGRYLDALLYGGVTTVLDPGNTMPYVTQIKQEIAAGRLRGPRVFCAGPMIDSGDPIWPPLAEPLTSFGQIPRVVARLADNHVDFIKIYAGLSDLHVQTFADEGRKVGLRVIVDMWDRKWIGVARENAARFVDGEKADWGTIAPGKCADLVVVSGRPHERIGDTRTIVDVVQAGRLIDRAALRVQPGEPPYRTSGHTFHPPPAR